MMRQMSIFDGAAPFKIDKPIRLITLFSGYDSQALALKYLGVPFEHYRTCEWAIPSIQALHDLHFADDLQQHKVGKKYRFNSECKRKRPRNCGHGKVLLHYDILVSLPRFEQCRTTKGNGKGQRHALRVALGS